MKKPIELYNLVPHKNHFTFKSWYITSPVVQLQYNSNVNSRKRTCVIQISSTFNYSKNWRPETFPGHHAANGSNDYLQFSPLHQYTRIRFLPKTCKSSVEIFSTLGHYIVHNGSTSCDDDSRPSQRKYAQPSLFRIHIFAMVFKYGGAEPELNWQSSPRLIRFVIKLLWRQEINDGNATTLRW